MLASHLCTLLLAHVLLVGVCQHTLAGGGINTRSCACRCTADRPDSGADIGLH